MTGIMHCGRAWYLHDWLDMIMNSKNQGLTWETDFSEPSGILTWRILSKSVRVVRVCAFVLRRTSRFSEHCLTEE